MLKILLKNLKLNSGWVNGGYFVLSQKIMQYINSCNESWETGPLPRLVKERKLAADINTKTLAANGYFKRKTDSL